jgi:hypothetical protein
MSPIRKQSHSDVSRRRSISRRAFLKSGALTVGALGLAMASPETPAFADDTRVARFIIGSDVHIAAHDSPNKLPKVLEWMATMGPTRICLVGDIVDSGSISQYDQLNSIISASPFGSDVQGTFIFCQGNHETYDPGVAAAPERFKEKLGQEANKLLSVNGIPVITMGPNSGSDSNYTANLDFLTASLEQVADDTTTYTPGMPILVLCHHSIPNTAYTSEEWYGSYGSLVDVMRSYPQIIHVSGHSHATVEDPRSIDQSLGFTCIQDATLTAYFECERNKPHTMYDKDSGTVSSYPQTGDDWSKAAQCVVIDVMQDGRSVVTRYDLYPLMDGKQARQLYEPWVVDTSNMGYQKTRKGTAKPQLPASGEVTYSDLEADSAMISFPAFKAATSDNLDMIHDYKVVAQPVDGDGNDAGDPIVRRYFADYFKPEDQRHDATGEPFKVCVSGLSYGTSYKVSVFAETPFADNDQSLGVSDELAMAGLLSTGDAELPEEILDIDFRTGSAEDGMGHALKQAGGKLVEATDLVEGEAVTVYESDGTGGFRYALESKDYSFFKNASTTECLFKMVDVQADQCVFSNQQGAGAGFEVENGNLEYWYNLEAGGNPKPKAPIEAGTWVHAMAVNDGTSIVLYLNGEKATETTGGVLSVPGPKYYFVGCDTDSYGSPQFLTKEGTQVALARIYTRAFTAEEVAAAYQAAMAASQKPEMVLDIDYRRGTASDKCGHALTERGGKLVYDDGLVEGSSVPVYEADGTGGYCYSLDQKDYRYFTNESTCECLFKMKQLEADDYQNIFSNQQSAGSGFGVDNTTGKFEYWYHANGSYKIVRADVPAGEWHHAFATNKDDVLTLYIDGKKVDETEGGPMTIPAPKAYYVGCDTNVNTDPEFKALAGTRVALARIYPRALTREEIAQACEADKEVPDALIIDCDFSKGSLELALGAKGKLWDASLIIDAKLAGDNMSGKVLRLTGQGGVSFPLEEDEIMSIRETFSLECAFKMADVDTKQGIFSCFQDGGYGLSVEDGYLDFGVETENGQNPHASTPIDAGEWIHAVGVFDGAAAILYVNGIEMAKRLAAQANPAALLAASTIGGSGDQTTQMKAPSSTSLFLGADADATGNPETPAAGGTQVLFARLYSRPLTSEEVKSAYASMLAMGTQDSTDDGTDDTNGDSDGNTNTNGNGEVVNDRSPQTNGATKSGVPKTSDANLLTNAVSAAMALAGAGAASKGFSKLSADDEDDIS